MVSHSLFEHTIVAGWAISFVLRCKVYAASIYVSIRGWKIFILQITQTCLATQVMNQQQVWT